MIIICLALLTTTTITISLRIGTGSVGLVTQRGITRGMHRKIMSESAIPVLPELILVITNDIKGESENLYSRLGA